MLLHIELTRIKPSVWKRVVVPETMTLGRLHRVIQAAMGWSDSHLHEFEIAGERCGTPNQDGWGEPVHAEARKTLVKALQGKKSFNYQYDFGDGWHHRITVEKRILSIPMPQLPYCIDGQNACPPEDVGGEGGYSDFLEAMADPSHSDHDDMMSWYGDEFDPKAFDPELVNLRLCPIKV